MDGNVYIEVIDYAENTSDAPFDVTILHLDSIRINEGPVVALTGRGASSRLTATVDSTVGGATPDFYDIAWQSSNAFVATVGDSGLVTTTYPGGKAVITASALGVSGSAEVHVSTSVTADGQGSGGVSISAPASSMPGGLSASDIRLDLTAPTADDSQILAHVPDSAIGYVAMDMDINVPGGVSLAGPVAITLPFPAGTSAADHFALVNAADGTALAVTTGPSGITLETGSLGGTYVLVFSKGVGYNITVIGGTADRNRAKAGETVTVTAVLPDGKAFSRWTADGADVVFDNAAAQATTFVMPARSVVVTAVLEDDALTPEPPEPPVTPPSSGGGSSGSSSSGGSDIPDSQRGFGGAAQENPLMLTEAKAAFDAAMAARSEDNRITLRFTNKTLIPLEVLSAIAGWADEAGVSAVLHMDTTLLNVVLERTCIDPAQAQGDIAIGLAAAADSKALFEKHFDNNLLAYRLAHAGEYDMAVEIAVKADLSGMNGENLVFYNYDRALNQYRRIERPAYRIDSNGYLHFETTLGGEIVISDGELAKK